MKGVKYVASNCSIVKFTRFHRGPAAVCDFYGA